MQQSNFIFGMLLLAFIVFITLRGELPVYLSLLRGSTATGERPSSNTGSGGNPVTEGAKALLDNSGMTTTQAVQIIDLFGNAVP